MYKVVFYGMALNPAVMLDHEFKTREQANDCAREAAKLLIKAGYFHYQVYGPNDEPLDHIGSCSRLEPRTGMVHFTDRVEFQS